MPSLAPKHRTPGAAIPAAYANAKSLQYYKFGLAAIGVFTLALLIAVLVQGSSVRQDTKTEKAANKIAEQLNNYVNKRQQVPDSLHAAGINDVPKTVNYKKLSSSSYRFCVAYKLASSNYPSDISGVVSRGIYGASSFDSGSYSGSSQDSYYLYLGTSHKKGANCQTVSPYIDTSYNSGSSSSQGSLPTITDPKEAAIASGRQGSVCYISGYTTHWAGRVTSVATADGTPLAPTTGQDIIIKVQPLGETPVGEQTITFSAYNYNIFDSQCTSVSRSGFAVGDYVSVFQDSDTPYMIDAIVNFSK